MLREDAAALLDAYGVGNVPLGDLDLTPGLIERARAEWGDAPLARPRRKTEKTDRPFG